MLTLLRVLLLNALALNDLRSGRRRVRTLLVWLAVLVGVGPVVAAWTALVGMIYAAMRGSELPLYDLTLAGTYAMTQGMVLLTALPMAYSQLLRARDLSILLPLPYRPGQVVLAKLAVVWVFELLVGAALWGPVVAQHLIWTDGGPLRVASAVLLVLAMPVLPLCASSLVALLVANVPGLGRSRWFWQILTMTAAFGAWIVMRQGMPAYDSEKELADFATLKLAQMQQLGRLVPGLTHVVRALTADGLAAFSGLALALALAAAGVAAVLLLSDRLYLRPVLEGSGAGARGHGRAEAARLRPFVLSVARREIGSVLRDPPVAINALGGYVAVPIGFAAAFFMGPRGGPAENGGGELGSLLALLRAPETAAVAPVVFAALGLGAAALAALSSLFSASFSKDGRKLWLERSLPVSPFAVFLGKWLGGLMIAGVAHTVTLLALGLLLRLPPGPWFYAWLVGLLAIGACGALGLGIDALRPKLAWKETVEAVKQNANVVFGMLGSLVLLGVNALALWACVAWRLPPAAAWAAPVVLNLGLLAYALFLGRLAAARFGELEV